MACCWFMPSVSTVIECMYVCMCVCVCMYVYVCMHVRMYVRMCVYVCVRSICERSLEVKLPTIWTHVKTEVGRVREEKTREEERR